MPSQDFKSSLKASMLKAKGPEVLTCTSKNSFSGPEMSLIMTKEPEVLICASKRSLCRPDMTMNTGPEVLTCASKGSLSRKTKKSEVLMCAQCNFVHSKRQNLSQHVKMVHGKELKCHECNYRAAKGRRLTK